jgi:hypothetical protein
MQKISNLRIIDFMDTFMFQPWKKIGFVKHDLGESLTVGTGFIQCVSPI